MDEEKVKLLIGKLLDEIEQSEDVDQELLSAVKTLQSKIESLLDPENRTVRKNTALDDVIALEASFASNYPIAEKIIRELVNSLSRIGI